MKGLLGTLRLSGRVGGLRRTDAVRSVALARLTAHLSEVWPAAELEPEHQGAVRHSVHIFTLFGVVCTDGQTEVTFALALLHGGGALMFQTLVGRLTGVSQTLHRTHLLTQTALRRTLSPGAGHPLGGRAALQVTSHPGRGPALFGTLGLGQRVAALPALTQDDAVPVAWTTAGRTL